MMKKLLLIATLALASCKAPQFTIGMSEHDFKRHNHRAELVEASPEITVYKQINYPFGEPAKVKFFYFVNDKLVKMDEGTRRPDLTIDQTIHNN